MTNQDDWTQFLAMMWPAWVWEVDNGDADMAGVGSFWAGRTTVYYPDGRLQVGAGKVQQVGDWREWLAAGTSPPPF